MNNRTYLFPGFKNWTFKTSDAGCELHPPAGDPFLTVTADTPVRTIKSTFESVLWLKFHMSGTEAGEAASAILAFDWAAMISEAGSDVQHQTPNLPGWTLRISDARCGLWYDTGACVQITADTPISEIIFSVQRILQDILPPVEIDAQIDEVMRIDFRKLISNAWTPRAAPLLDGFTANNTAFVESICADVRLLALLQNADSAAEVEMIIALVKELE